MAKKRKDDEVEVQQDESSGGSIPVNDAWTGMLAISLLALMIGTGFLTYDYLQYSDKLPDVPKLVSKQPAAEKPPAEKPPEEKKAP